MYTNRLEEGSRKFVRSNYFHVISIGLDISAILYFFLSVFLWNRISIPLEFFFGTYFTLEYIVLFFASKSKVDYLKNPLSISNILIIVGYFSFAYLNLGILRIIRMLRVIHVYQLIPDMRMLIPNIVKWETMLTRIAHIIVLVVAVAEFIYIFQVQDNPVINEPFDALYAAITFIAQAGFGDIYLVGFEGKILSILITVISVSLFLQLLDALRKPKAADAYVCTVCGDKRHCETMSREDMYERNLAPTCNFCDIKSRENVN